MIRTQSQFPGTGHIRTLRTDQGTEFLNKHIKRLLFDYGITHEFSEKYVSQHNGLVERFNKLFWGFLACIFESSVMYLLPRDIFQM